MAPFNVSELNKLYAQINQVSGNSLSGTSFGQGMQSYNDIAWFSNAIGTVGEDNASPEQKASAIQAMVEKALSIFEKFANKEAQAASKEVLKETKASQELVTRSENLKINLEGSLSDIQTDIESQSGIITEAQESLIEVQESIEKKQQEIEDIVKEIEAKQKELANAKTPEEKASILTVIQCYAAEISNIGLSIEADATNLQNLQEAVDNTVTEIEASTQNLANTEQNGLQKLAEQANSVGNLGIEVTETGTKGTTNKATAVAAGRAADAASTNVFTGSSIATKLRMTENDQNQASSKRLGSIAGNLNKLAQGIGGLSNATQVIATFQNTIGGALDNYIGLIGQWDTALEPVITSIGSFTGIAEGVEELNTSVDTDLKNLASEVGGEDLQDTNSENSDNNNNANNTDSEESENISTSVELETPKFDVQKLRSFGI